MVSEQPEETHDTVTPSTRLLHPGLPGGGSVASRLGASRGSVPEDQVKAGRIHALVEGQAVGVQG